MDIPSRVLTCLEASLFIVICRFISGVQTIMVQLTYLFPFEVVTEIYDHQQEHICKMASSAFQIHFQLSFAIEPVFIYGRSSYRARWGSSGLHM